jgi:hypothetical protein
MKNRKTMKTFKNTGLSVQDNPITSLCNGIKGIVTLRGLDKQN